MLFRFACLDVHHKQHVFQIDYDGSSTTLSQLQGTAADGKERWRVLGYYMNMSNAVDRLLQTGFGVFPGELKDVLLTIERLAADIRRVLAPFERSASPVIEAKAAAMRVDPALKLLATNKTKNAGDAVDAPSSEPANDDEPFADLA